MARSTLATLVALLTGACAATSGADTTTVAVAPAFEAGAAPWVDPAFDGHSRLGLGG